MNPIRMVGLTLLFALVAGISSVAMPVAKPEALGPVVACKKSCTDDSFRCANTCGTDSSCLDRCEVRTAHCSERCSERR